VYRAFRLAYCSKYGKSAALRLTHRFGGAELCPRSAFPLLLIGVLRGRLGARGWWGTSLGELPMAARRQQRPLSLLRLDDAAVDWAAELAALPFPTWRNVPALLHSPLPHNTPPIDFSCTLPGTALLSPLPMVSTVERATPTGAAAAVAAGPCSVWYGGSSPYCQLEAFVTAIAMPQVCVCARVCACVCVCMCPYATGMLLLLMMLLLLLLVLLVLLLLLLALLLQRRVEHRIAPHPTNHMRRTAAG
jgi:hypothetical protein